MLRMYTCFFNCQEFYERLELTLVLLPTLFSVASCSCYLFFANRELQVARVLLALSHHIIMLYIANAMKRLYTIQITFMLNTVNNKNFACL